MKQLIFLIIFLNYTMAYEFKLNERDMAYINNSDKKSFILNRINKYENLKIEVKDYELIRKLSHINSFINKIFPIHDISTQASIDYWATPKEFLLQGHGDCEDYAIAKYFTLLELGVKKESLYLAVVNVKASAGTHMVLLYVENKNSSPLVLDNLSFRVLPFSKRDDLTPVVAFNELNAYEFTKDKFTQLVTIDWQNNNKWDRVLNRVYKLNE